MTQKTKVRLLTILLLIGIFWAVFLFDYSFNKVDEYSVFSSNVEIVQKEEKVGADIRLKQAIHGPNDIHYRYIIKTDCPEWDFETRYMATEPIEWVDETSAVEVDIYDVQIRYNGTVYANGQYYTVPILGGISSENIPLDEWKNNLMKQAYQAYVSDKRPKPYTIIIGVILFLYIIKCFISGLIDTIKSRKKVTKIFKFSSDDLTEEDLAEGEDYDGFAEGVASISDTEK